MESLDLDVLAVGRKVHVKSAGSRTLAFVITDVAVRRTAPRLDLPRVQSLVGPLATLFLLFAKATNCQSLQEFPVAHAAPRLPCMPFVCIR